MPLATIVTKYDTSSDLCVSLVRPTSVLVFLLMRITILLIEIRLWQIIPREVPIVLFSYSQNFHQLFSQNKLIDFRYRYSSWMFCLRHDNLDLLIVCYSYFYMLSTFLDCLQ